MRVADAYSVAISLLGRNAFSDVARQVGKDIDTLGRKSDSLGEQFLGLGRVTSKMAVGAAAAITTTLVGAVGVLGKAVWDAGNQFDAAYDAIAISTGETGEALEGLTQDFDAVYRSIPVDDIQAAGRVLGSFSVRTGLTGETLQTLTSRMLEASRVLGGDAVRNTELFTRVLGDWGVQTEDASGTMDMFFRASQKTGIGMDQLMSSVVQFGAPMRLMGFSMEDAIAIFGKWEKEGVNAELVMGSLRMAAAEFAREGKPLRESLLATFESIQNNTDASAALTEGMEIFGARAGPDMVAAIREGRFEFEDLLTVLGDADGAIEETAAATMDWGERMQIFQQRVQSALAPAGEMLMGVANTLIEKFLPVFEERIVPILEEQVIPAIERVVESITMLIEGDVEGALENLVGPETAAQIIEVADAVKGFIDQAAAFVTEHSEAFKGALTGIGVVLAAAAIAATIAGVAAALASLVTPIGLIIAAAALLGAAWSADWGGIRTTLTAFWEETAKPFIDQLVKWFETDVPVALAVIRDWFSITWARIQGAVARVWHVLSGIWSALVLAFTVTIPAAGTGMWTSLSNTLSGIQQTFTDIWNGIMGFLSAAWDTIRIIVLAGIILVLGLLGTNLDEIKARWDAVWGAVSAFLRTIWDGISSTVRTVLAAVVGFITSQVNQIRTSWETTWGIVRDTASTIWGSIRDTISGILSGLIDTVLSRASAIRDGLIGPLISARDTVSGMVGRWAQIGRDLLDGLIGGVRERVENLVGTVRGAIDGAINEARRRLGIRSPSRVFADIGRSIEEGLTGGILAGKGGLEDAIQELIASGRTVGEQAVGQHLWGMGNGGTRMASPVAPVASNISYRYEYHLQNSFARPDDPVRIEHVITALEAAHV